jgi:phenylalanyl-tRNA synthetase alpha chain
MFNNLNMAYIKIDTSEQEKLLKELDKRTDFEASRIKRYLSMPDLSRTEESPLKEIVDRASKVKSLAGFDCVEIPEIIPAKILFDLFNMPPGHPARSKSDTYYVDEENVLRTHDTVFWYYYLTHPEIKKRIENKETLGAICYGKVYRKDEIDSRHMNVFHQFGGLLLAPDDKQTITPQDLKNALSEIARSIFGEQVNFRFYDHNFPYTDPSFEMEAEINGRWIEMLGSGMARKSVLSNFGLEGYHGWAFGFGLERLAIASMTLPDIRLLWSEDERVKKQLKLGQKFVEVSKFPPVIRDISFIVNNSFVPNDYFDMVREVGGQSVEQVELLDKYENEQKFGPGKISYAYRITYRSLDKTLTDEEVNSLHKKLEEATIKNYDATVR